MFAKETQSLPSKLKDYSRLRENQESRLLEEISISDSSSLEDAEMQPLTNWALPNNVIPILLSQSIHQMCIYFQTKKEVQPPIDEMLGMSPLSKAKFRHRENKSEEWEDTPIKPKKLSLLEEVKRKEMQKQFSIDDFEKGRLLGRGRFAHVWLVRERLKGFVVVLKCIQKKKLRKYRAEKALRNEIEIQSHLSDHANILRLFGYFDDEESIYLILEYSIQGDLFYNIHHFDMTEHQIAMHVYQIANALLYMHSKSVIHRDLKPENIFISHDGKIKIADFGWAIKTNTPQDVIVGTVHYMAPEMMSGVYDTRVDIWALGILLFELFDKKLPFFPGTFEELKDLFEQRCFNKVPKDAPSADAADLVVRLLELNPKKRISLTEVLFHPWIVTHKSIESNCNPSIIVNNINSNQNCDNNNNILKIPSNLIRIKKGNDSGSGTVSPNLNLSSDGGTPSSSPGRVNHLK